MIGASDHMSIRVECPNGHTFRVKDKYAGKKGLCPHCEGEVVVRVPATPSEVTTDWKQERKKYSVDEHDAELVYDDPHHGEGASDTGQSLVGSSAIKHGKRCDKCGAQSPIWYASCPKCGEFFAG